jgi:hypothetical protein
MSNQQLSAEPGQLHYSNPFLVIGVLHNNLDNGAVPQTLAQAISLYQAAYGGVPILTLSQYGLFG